MAHLTNTMFSELDNNSKLDVIFTMLSEQAYPRNHSTPLSNSSKSVKADVNRGHLKQLFEENFKKRFPYS